MVPTVRWGEWIGEGWQMFAEQWQAWVVHILVFGLIMLIPMVPFYMLVFAAGILRPQEDNPTLPLAIVGIYPIVFLLILLISAYLMSGAYRSAFKQLRGERIQLRDLFSGGDCWGRVLGALLLITILTGIGMMLCIIPGFIVAGLFFFTIPLIVERNLGVTDAMRASYEVTRQNLLMFTLFAFVLSLLASLGALACYVGLLVTYPLYFTVMAVAYRDCFGVPGARSFAQGAPPPPPSYGSPYSPPPSAIACPNCQAEVPNGALFCIRCGHRMREE